MSIFCILGLHKWKILQKGLGAFSPDLGEILFCEPRPKRICLRCRKKQIFLGAFEHPWGPKWIEMVYDDYES